MSHSQSPTARERLFVDQLMRLARVRRATRDVRGMELFRTCIVPFADEILARAVAAEEERIGELSKTQRGCLDLFDEGPDLLSPMGDEYYEPIHTQMLSYFLGLPNDSPLGERPLRAFLDLLGTEAEPPGLVVPEVALSKRGRVDIRLLLPGWLIYVEVKLAAQERPGQLEDYHEHATSEARRHGRHPLVVFLTQDNRHPSRNTTKCIRFHDVLAAWLPIASSAVSPAHRHLAMYLRTLAVYVCEVACVGAFRTWTSRDRADLLGFLERHVG